MQKRTTTWFHLEPLLAVILWGGIYPGAKLGLREMSVLSFTYLRIVLAMVVLFVVSGRTQGFRFPTSLWPSLLKAGLAQTMFQLLLIAGLQKTTAGHSAILLATAPLLTAGWLSQVVNSLSAGTGLAWSWVFSGSVSSYRAAALG